MAPLYKALVMIFSIQLQAAEAGLPPLPDSRDNSEYKLKMSQSVLDTLQAEEDSGTAKLESDLENNLGEEERRQLSEKMKEHLVSVGIT